jgi:hypothetical protein
MTSISDFDIQIAETMSLFDFDKVHKVMTCLDWRWCDNVPTVSELKKHATILLRDAIKFQIRNDHLDPEIFSSGGLEAVCYPNGQLELRFILEKA